MLFTLHSNLSAPATAACNQHRKQIGVPMGFWSMFPLVAGYGRPTAAKVQPRIAPAAKGEGRGEAVDVQVVLRKGLVKRK